MVSGSLASFAISAELCWFTTAKELIPYVQPALKHSKFISTEVLPEKRAPPQIINLCCTGNNGFHTPNRHLCYIKYQGNLPQMWRKTPAKLLCICSHCTNCSRWNSPTPFVQQQSGRAQHHMHNERKTIVKWWAKTMYRLGKDALTSLWKGTTNQRGGVDLQCQAPLKPCKATCRHQTKLEKVLNLWKGQRELVSKIKGFAS